MKVLEAGSGCKVMRPFVFLIFQTCFHQFLKASQWVKGPQILSLDLKFIDLAAQREGDHSQSQFQNS